MGAGDLEAADHDAGDVVAESSGDVDDGGILVGHAVAVEYAVVQRVLVGLGDEAAEGYGTGMAVAVVKAYDSAVGIGRDELVERVREIAHRRDVSSLTVASEVEVVHVDDDGQVRLVVDVVRVGVHLVRCADKEVLAVGREVAAARVEGHGGVDGSYGGVDGTAPTFVESGDADDLGVVALGRVVPAGDDEVVAVALIESAEDREQTRAHIEVVDVVEVAVVVLDQQPSVVTAVQPHISAVGSAQIVAAGAVVVVIAVAVDGILVERFAVFRG